MKLDELFEIKNGISSNAVDISNIKTKEYSLPFIRPSSNYLNLVAGYLNPELINPRLVFPKESIFVSTNGEGSHTYSYVSPFSFVPNSDVAVLIPRKEMTLQEKIYYSLCITRNRYKFSYGRKPKGKRLQSINLPDSFPSHLSNIQIINPFKSNERLSNLEIELSDRTWRVFEYSDLFNVIIGKSVDLNKLQQSEEGINYVGRTEENNGITAQVIEDGSFKKYEGNCITVPMVGNELKSSYQYSPFCVSQNIAILRPKFPFNKYIALFLNTMIRMDAFRFAYGRTLSLDRLKKLRLRLPVDQNLEPDWEFMENYIKSLPYSTII